MDQQLLCLNRRRCTIGDSKTVHTEPKDITTAEMKTYCFKLYHSEHNDKLMRQINIAGLIYNHCVALHRRYYSLFGKYIQPYMLMKHLTKLKHTKRFAYIRKLGSQAGWKLDEKVGRIRLGKKWYGYFQSRKIEGQIKTVTVKRDAVGDIYVYFVSEVQCGQVELKSGKSVGFDFGLKTFLTASDGCDIVCPDFFKQNVKTIRTKSRKLSRKKEGSNNRERARLDLVRVYRKMDNQRRDFHFKTARKLCEQYAVICLETLNIKGMAKLWGRKIHSLGFSNFVKILQYEATKFGTQIVFVPQYYPSSQLCHVCGCKNEGVKNLRVREWYCPSCHTHHDRDKNAAKNILVAGTSAISGDTVRANSLGSIVDARIPRL